MKRGTVLLMLALAVQGLATFSVFGMPGNEKLAKEERRQKRHEQRQKERKKQLEEHKSSAAQRKQEEEQKVREELNKELNAAMSNMRQKVTAASYANAVLRGQKTELTPKTNDAFAVSFPQAAETATQKETPAIATEEAKEKDGKKAEPVAADTKSEEAEVENAQESDEQTSGGWLAWIQGSSESKINLKKVKEKLFADIKNRNYKLEKQASLNKESISYETRSNYRQDQKDKEKHLKAWKKQIQSVHQELLKKREQQACIEEEFSSFEDDNPRSSTATQKAHSSLWKTTRNPSDPDNLIGLLANSRLKIPNDEVQEYEKYGESAVRILIALLEASHTQRSTAKNADAKRAICRTNKGHTQKLMKLLALLDKHKLSLSKKSKEMIEHWLQENRNAVAELKEARQTEEQEFFNVQTECDVRERLGIVTITELITRARHIAPRHYQSGPKKAANIAQMTEISQHLVEQIKNKTVQWREVELFVQTLQEKDILLDPESLTSLQLAVTEAQNHNDAQLAGQIKANIAFDDQAQDLSSSVSYLLKNFAQVALVQSKQTPHVDYAREFEDWQSRETEFFHNRDW